MAITKITTSGTFQLKTMPGYIRALSVPNAGTNWTLQLFDGPNPAGGLISNYGGTSPGTLTVNTGLLTPQFFGVGIQVVTAGAAPGELDVDWI
jgi:hypothetical protein